MHATVSYGDQIQTRRSLLGFGRRAQDLSQPAPTPIPHHRRAKLPAQGKTDAHAPLSRSEADTQRATLANLAPTQLREIPAFETPDQADSFARPFCLRARSTALPARVLIRLRNPCRFARRRTFG